jgi:F-type H+-transporting ATPase subunit delta
LAEEAVPIELIDAGAAREALTKAQGEASRASQDKDKAEAQIALEVAEALVEASK